jgi:hypothetical protein
MAFPASDLAALDAAQEIEIETRSPNGEKHRAVIWVMVRDGSVYVRSYKGPRGRWYREAVADPEVSLLVDGRYLPARAEEATDPASVAAASDGLRDKYGGDPSLQAMLDPDVLPTTLRVVPA